MGAWTWLAVGIAAWLAAAFVVGVVVGQMFRAAEPVEPFRPWGEMAEDVSWDWPRDEERLA